MPNDPALPKAEHPRPGRDPAQAGPPGAARAPLRRRAHDQGRGPGPGRPGAAGRRRLRRQDLDRRRWRRSLEQRRRRPAGRKADGEQPRHLQLVPVRRPQHVQELQDPRPRRHQGDVLLVQRRAAGHAAGGGTGYDIIVPSQNAVGELVQLGSLMKLDKALIPNAAAVESSWVKTAYDTTGDYNVVKDFGVTMFFYNNKIVTEKPTTMKQFYDLLPKYGKVGRTNLLDGAEEVVPLALMALGYDPNTGDPAVLDKAKSFLLSIRGGVTTIDSSNYINDASAGKIILGQGWNGDMRRIVAARKTHGSDITAVLPMDTSEKWADNWCIPATAPDPVAAHAWINHLCDPAVAVKEMEYHNYPVPIQAALDQTPAALKNDPLFNVPTSYTGHYKFILNPSQEIVNARTQIYTAFQSA